MNTRDLAIKLDIPPDRVESLADELVAMGLMEKTDTAYRLTEYGLKVCERIGITTPEEGQP